MRERIWSLAAAMILALLPFTAHGDTPCADCHEETATHMAKDVHLRIQPFEVAGRTVGCEGCHGDGAAHAASGNPADIRNPKEPAGWTPFCLDCHKLKGKAEFRASTHGAEGLGCTDCHVVHKEQSAHAACANCHADTLARFQMPSHHPVREGHMTCSSCHDVHATTEAQLRTKQRVSDLCFSCHQEKEGPFVFEHAPVQEDCRTCHTAHGSVANNLLTANEPMVCLQCHEFHFHAGYRAADEPVHIGGAIRRSPNGARSFNVGFTTKCTQCHSHVHGSDLPSQSVTGRGRGLTR